MSDAIGTKAETALYLCGTENVLTRSKGGEHEVAVRRRRDGAPTYYTGRASSLDAAGLSAARQFAAALRAEGLALISWAERIESAMGAPADDAAKGGA